MMKLVEQSLAAYEAARLEQERAGHAALKRQVKDVEDRVRLMFGIPFAEAFDTTRVEVSDRGTVTVDGYIHLWTDKEGLYVSVYVPDGGPRVGDEHFSHGGFDRHQQNLSRLGFLLAQAYTYGSERA